MNIIFKGKYILALFTSLLFAVHPITTEPVNAISFREDLIVMSFCLISFLSYIKFFDTKKKFYFHLSLISFVIALFSKENAVILPLILILYTLSFEGEEELFKRKYYYAIYFIILVMYIYLTHYSSFTSCWKFKPLQETGNTYSTFLTMLKVFAIYIKLLILPIDLKLEYVIPVSYSLFEPFVLMSGIVLLLCFVVGIIMYKHDKIIFFAIFYFLITLLPVSNIIVRLVFLMADRYLYMPLWGFCIIVPVIFDKIRLPKSFKLTLLIFLLICYSFLTFFQNKVWKNEKILWETTLKKNPYSYRAYNNLGVIYEKEGNLDKAEKYLKKAIELNKNAAELHSILGSFYIKVGNLDKAEEYLKKAIELNKNFADAYYNLGVLSDKIGDIDKAEEYYKKAIKIKIDHTQAYNSLGGIYEKKGLLDKAEEYFRKVIELDNKSPEAYYNLGVVYRKKGLLDKAEEYLKKAIELNKNFAEAYYNLGVLSDKIGDIDKAEEYYKKAIKIKPDHTQAYNNLGIIYGKRGDLRRAEEYFKKAIELNKNFAEAYYNLGMSYRKKGNLDKAEEYFKKAIELDKNK